MEGMLSCLEFSKDEASDVAILIKLFEQAVCFKTQLNPLGMTAEVMCEFLESLTKTF